MTRISVIVSRIATKKVSALAMLSVAIFGMVVGVAIAAFTIGSFSNTYSEGGAAYTPSPPNGVSFINAGNNLASLTSPSSAGQCTSSDTSTATSADSLTSGTTIFGCLNSVPATGYSSSDSIEYSTVSWDTAASAGTTYELSIFYNTSGASTSPMRIFVKTPATITSTTSLMVTYDLTTAGATGINSVEVLVHQCVGTTCP